MTEIERQIVRWRSTGRASMVVRCSDHQEVVAAKDEELDRLKGELDRKDESMQQLSDRVWQAEQALPAELEARAEELYEREQLAAGNGQLFLASGFEQSASRLRERAAELRGGFDG